MSRLISRLLAAAMASMLLAYAIPAQAQSVVFADIRDAVPLKFFNPAPDSTMPDPANPNTLVIGFESGRDSGDFLDDEFRATTRAFGNRVAMDTLSFNIIAPPGFYVASVSYAQEGTGEVLRVADARGTTSWVVNNQPTRLGVFRTNPTVAGTALLSEVRPVVVAVSVTTSLFAFAPPSAGEATVQINAARVTATIAPIDPAVVKKTALIQVNGFTGPYDGAPHGATGTATGTGGEDLSGLLSFGDTFTDAPGGTAQWSFAGNADYHSAVGAAAIVIEPVNATVNVAGFSGVYNGTPRGATGTAVGVLNENLAGFLNLGATFTDVPGGTAHWTFSGNPNYNAAEGDVEISISKATAVVSWAPPASVVAGTTLSATQLNATADVPGTFVYSPPAGTVLTASQDLSVTFTPNDTVNYNGASATVPIVVTPAITAQIINPGPQSDRVGDNVNLRLRVTAATQAERRGVFTAAGLPPGLDVDRNEIEGEPTTAGTYFVTVTFAPSGGGSTSTQFEWTVLPRRRG